VRRTLAAATLPLGLCLAVAGAAADVAVDDLVQLCQQRSEEPTLARWLDPEIRSVRWKSGHLEVRLLQSAPCGWMPVNPDWRVNGLDVTLRSVWGGVRIAKSFQRFGQQEGRIVVIQEPR
jgi:hypothetical protein